MHIDDLQRWLAVHGAQPAHAGFVLRRWLQALPEARSRRPAHHLPRRLATALAAPESPFDTLAQVASAHPAADGSTRLLLALADRQSVESVLLPRGGLCVSTQVGCAVGCRFCMTGRDGLLRQLGSAEIVAQVAVAAAHARVLAAAAALHARSVANSAANAASQPVHQALNKVVFMGMGEPAHNLDAVLAAIDLLAGAGGIAHEKLVFSTVGDVRVFERLPRQRVRPALALSLHSTFAERRAHLLPRAPRIAPDELVERADAYARSTGYPVQYQWTLLEGVNDGADEIEGITRLLSGRHGVLNLIPYNATDGGATDGGTTDGSATEGKAIDGARYRRPSWEHAALIARTLHRRGILTKLRHSAGQDVDGGCGQLRARDLPLRWHPRRQPAALVASLR
jgi:23S rRNA (adenine2503-C2)-methyltransferase